MLPSDAPVGSLGWMSRGACQGEDPELFFPFTANGAAVHQITAAKAVCARCPVRAICLAYAVTTGQDGIWGGTTPEERRALQAHPGSPPVPAANPARTPGEHHRCAARRPAGHAGPYPGPQLAGQGVLSDILARWHEAHRGTA
jgi:WhiB family redox-sensing transcriptional regulator